MKKFITTLAIAATISTSAWAEDIADLTIDVNGLVCDFCAQAIQKVFGKQEDVEKVYVDLDEKHIAVWFNEGGDINDETLTKLVTDAGYNVVQINRGE